MTIFEIIQVHAERHPQADAISAPERKPMNYGQLISFMKNTVSALNDLGLGRNDRVAVVLQNGPEMAVSFIAIASAATCAPLNPAYREEDFRFYLSDLQAKALVVQEGVETPAEMVAVSLDIPVIKLRLSKDHEAGSFTLLGEKGSRNSDRGLTKSEDVALVLHTSGTTSRPKIVPLTQNNLCVSARNIALHFELTSSDRCLNIMPLFHIHGLIGGGLSTLSTGGNLICTPGFDSSSFFAWMETFRPTWFTAVPTMHHTILDGATKNPHALENHSLRFIRSCSAPLPPQLMDRLEKAFSVPVVESYGMTEASHQISSNPLPPLTRKPRSVGVAAGTQMAIMDEGGEIVGFETEGEIVIRGENVLKAYDSNPEANKASFADGWFRTGDQGYIDSDGYVFITGRIKEIINRGGRKISPREVDEALMDHPEVDQAVTFALPHETLGEDVISAVVLNDKASVSDKDIRNFAFDRLAEFKVPTKVIIIGEIPKGPTGKLQRIGLADKLSHLMRSDFIPPRTDVEKELVALWTEVLKVSDIGVKDNFFMLGGNSLTATQVISRIRETFKVDLPVETAFKSPTVEDLSIIISVHMAEEVDDQEVARILGELDGLSEEELEKLLAEDHEEPSEQDGGKGEFST